MTPLQLELTRLIGKKDLSFGCLVLAGYEGETATVIGISDNRAFVDLYDGRQTDRVGYYTVRDICLGHPATLSDFHRWMNEKNVEFTQENNYIYPEYYSRIPYNSSLPLLEQDESTLEQIISLISNNS